METPGMNELEKITNYILLVSGKISDVSLKYLWLMDSLKFVGRQAKRASQVQRVKTQDMK